MATENGAAIGGGDGLRLYAWKTSYSDDSVNAFLIPALERSVRYDRAAGFFSSTVFSVAARGVSRLIRNGGSMRLLTSARLTQEDVEALEKGFSEREVVKRSIDRETLDPADLLAKKRLEALAWLAANGKLQVRIAVPYSGGKIRPTDTEMFHSKVGIFTDKASDQISFCGSVNETATAWTANIEYFQVHTSWGPSSVYHQDNVKYFEMLWSNAFDKAKVFDFTEATREKLIKYTPREPPLYEPEEEVYSEAHRAPSSAQVDAALFWFIRDAPLLRNGGALADAFIPFKPRPHQLAVANTVVANYPRRFLLADEVGLGKTIEAGLVLKRLILSGRVTRCLILTPASIRRQWQEQLRDKFGLNFKLYETDKFVDAYNKVSPVRDNPLAQENLVIASAQLVSRRSRRDSLLSAPPWDVVVLDEAHHARRRLQLSFNNEKERGEPNLLLRLMDSLKERTVGLLLLTATPMQLDTVELFDLLNLLGTKGRWATDEEAFRTYFQAVATGDLEEAGDVAFEMAREYASGTDDFDEVVRNTLGAASLTRVKHVFESPNPLEESRKLSPDERKALLQYMKLTTPLRPLMFRNTRKLIDEYRRRGLAEDAFPKRVVEDKFVELSPEEREIYNAVQEYVVEFYNKAQKKNALVLKIILLVLMRRLTSSVVAVKKTLRRRLEAIRADETGLDEEDLEDFDEEAEDDNSEELKAEEEARLKELIQRLEGLGADSKLAQFLSDLDKILEKHERVLVFTQYTDTMDYIREQVAEKYGSAVACYSGRGGEIYEDGAWRQVAKDYVERALRDKVKILIGTDAMGEGLDLQSASVVVNYDMPWNPMKVEQRIGRVDRVGQKSSEVNVKNYFYEGTVEARIYQVLNSRHQFFTEVVGEAPQILAKIGRLIEEGVTKPTAEIECWIKEKEQELIEKYEELKRNKLIDEEMTRTKEITETMRSEEAPPVTPKELEDFLLSHPLTVQMFSKTGDKIYAFSADGLSPSTVTFDADVAEKGDAKLISYTSPEMRRILESTPPPTAAGNIEHPRIIRVLAKSQSGRSCVGYFYRHPSQGLKEVSNFQEFKNIVETGPDTLPPLSKDDVDAARKLIEERLKNELGEEAKRLMERHIVGIENAKLRCRNILDKIVAAAVKLELVQQGYAADTDNPSQTEVSRQLERLISDKKYYVPALLGVTGVTPETYSIPEHVFRGYRGKEEKELSGELGSLKQAAERALGTYRERMSTASIGENVEKEDVEVSVVV